MRGAWVAVMVIGILLAGAARAEIYEWEDGSGARHFTNDKRGVPAAYQDQAHVLVADWSRSATEPAAAAPAAAPPVAAVQVVSDTQWSEGYAAGMRAAADSSGGGGGGVQINAPLAVVSTRTSEGGYGGGYPYGVYPPWPWYYPFVTTGFDRGRSRHQTLRMLLQDQFQLDRDGPYAYQRWDEPGLGPALAPFLQRGLPYGVSQYGRVIYR